MLRSSNMLRVLCGAMTLLVASALQLPQAAPLACNVADIQLGGDMFNNVVKAGERKASYSALKTFQLGVIAGTHTGYGALLVILVGNNCPALAEQNPGLKNLLVGVFGLPFALFMTVVTGAELFTGNTAVLTAAVLEKRATCRQLAKNWACSFIGNLVGTFIIAYLAKTSGVVGNVGNLVAIGKYKTSLGPYTAFTRGILCNWLVCMAVYMSYGVSSATGKFIAIFLPISAFSAMGFEHSVANMFTIPCSMLHGSGVGLFKYLLSNLLPVTLGNIVAGAVAVAFGYSLPFGTHTRAQSTHS